MAGTWRVLFRPGATAAVAVQAYLGGWLRLIVRTWSTWTLNSASLSVNTACGW
jgi:hypothetical protein